MTPTTSPAFIQALTKHEQEQWAALKKAKPESASAHDSAFALAALLRSHGHHVVTPGYLLRIMEHDAEQTSFTICDDTMIQLSGNSSNQEMTGKLSYAYHHLQDNKAITVESKPGGIHHVKILHHALDNYFPSALSEPIAALKAKLRHVNYEVQGDRSSTGFGRLILRAFATETNDKPHTPQAKQMQDAYTGYLTSLQQCLQMLEVQPPVPDLKELKLKYRQNDPLTDDEMEKLANCHRIAGYLNLLETLPYHLPKMKDIVYGQMKKMADHAQTSADGIPGLIKHDLELAEARKIDSKLLCILNGLEDLTEIVTALKALYAPEMNHNGERNNWARTQEVLRNSGQSVGIRHS